MPLSTQNAGVRCCCAASAAVREMTLPFLRVNNEGGPSHPFILIFSKTFLTIGFEPRPSYGFIPLENESSHHAARADEKDFAGTCA